MFVYYGCPPHRAAARPSLERHVQQRQGELHHQVVVGGGARGALLGVPLELGGVARLQQLVLLATHPPACPAHLHKHNGNILTTDQSDAGHAGIFA
eukprot:591841-Pyramimonas_sp.AAC.1